MRIDADEAREFLALLEHALADVSSAPPALVPFGRVALYERLRFDLRMAVASGSGRVRYFEFRLRKGEPEIPPHGGMPPKPA